MANQEQSQNGKPQQAGAEDNRGDGPGKIGLASDKQPDLVQPSGVNQRDHGSTGEAPMAGGQLNFDDDEVMSGRANSGRTGGTWDAKGADSGKLAPPSEILSDRNGPSDPESGSGKPRS